MFVYHNSHDLRCRTPFGAAATNSAVTLALFLQDAPGYSCFLRLWQADKGETLLPMTATQEAEDMQRFSCTIHIPDEPGLLWYMFCIHTPDGELLYYGNREDGLGGEGQCSKTLPYSYQITVYRPEHVPEWYSQAVVYQIFPDRFARGSDWLDRFVAAAYPDSWTGPRRVLQYNWNDQPFYTRDSEKHVTRWPFFGGTLSGILEKLPYLHDLGITAIYLNPIFRAYSNHRYDTADYHAIDPILGTEEDFRHLSEEAKNLGIRLILDGVFSHTGADSIYFNRYQNYPSSGACQGADSPYYGWFHFQEFPNQYDSWWGVEDLPKVDKNQASFRNYIYASQGSVVRHWLRSGASGWRLDVADELPDDFIEGIRTAIREEDPDALLIGEVWEDASNKESYGVMRKYLFGSELDGVMNYPFRKALIDFFLQRMDAPEVCRHMMSLKENYPPETYYGNLNLIGSHDRVRILTVLGGAPENLSEAEQAEFSLTPEARKIALSRLFALTTLQFTAAGVPCIYYGDEVGMEGCSDPFNRGTYPWGQEDTTLREHYKQLIALRKEHPALVSGDFLPISSGPDLYGCLRTGSGEQLMSLASRSSQETAFSLPNDCIQLLFGNAKIDSHTIALPPYGFCILRCGGAQ